MTDAKGAAGTAGEVRVFVTHVELGGAMGYAMVHPAEPRVKTDVTVMGDVRQLLDAVRQPCFDADHRRTGEVREGKAGADDLFRGFGPGNVRGLWIDRGAAAALGKADVLDGLVERTKGRDVPARIASRAADRIAAKGAGRGD